MAFEPFEDLEVWQTAREFRKSVYAAARSFPKIEEYALANQIRRAAVSVTANIAEGHGRYHYQDNIRFCRMARGSLSEVRDHLHTALDEGYVAKETFDRLQDQAHGVARLLNAYIGFLRRKKAGGDVPNQPINQ